MSDKADAPADARDEIERIRSFVRGIEDRSATRVVPFRWGRALFNDDYPRSSAHNFLRVEADAADLDARGLIAEADRLHSEAGHNHRQVSVDSEAVAARVADGFKDAGWKIERLVAMVHRRAPNRGANASQVREVDFPTVRSALAEFYRRAPFGDSEETIRQLVERSLVTAQATDVRHFAVIIDGEVVSTCDLYSDGSTAQIEDVNTFEEFRGRGFARATVARALAEARAAGCDLVFLVADDDDWPKTLYSRMGFDPAARFYSFIRPG